MAGSEVALDVENSIVKTERLVIEHWKSMITKGKSAPKDKGNRSSRKWSTILKESFDPQGRFYPIWIKVFVISCVFAVSLDPLFFYIPIVNEDMKCLILDKNLKAIALSFRSLTDRFYIVDIIFQILISLPTPKSPGDAGVTKQHKEAPVKGNKPVKDALVIANRIFRSYILVDILAALPIPQVVIFIFFSKTRGSRSLKTRKLLNSLLVLQYVPRVLRIFLLCHERHLVPRNAGLWVKGVFNFFLYILASHVDLCCVYIS
ncbi:cyclic nucleotide-gated ion channel 1-like [Prunus yedoensis var. nudiflora]|uniref:Cyclic nucleotide-gated ion channel 1-like n=1 Tax=Prunus yedoensis var. nudiflora TaxID=2094558 RepID=A0A314V130_PRUYE|nr:cyclic nucleotide-gated ion channel 1-like [Prunus yedoensis var. nudiflora]